MRDQANKKNEGKQTAFLGRYLLFLFLFRGISNIFLQKGLLKRQLYRMQVFMRGTFFFELGLLFGGRILMSPPRYLPRSTEGLQKFLSASFLWVEVVLLLLLLDIEASVKSLEICYAVILNHYHN